ncbi:MAG TPA: hypothetical protein VHU42_09625 [Rhodopila sp.]|jgi:hypothetical protein|nr:hypothetical protein [Rhodopila sp.]
MRTHLLAVIAMLCAAGPALAQGPTGGSVPAEIGNRANGLDYQPTQSEVVPREKASGIEPPISRERAANADLIRMDKDLLLSEGIGTDSVPKLSNSQ